MIKEITQKHIDFANKTLEEYKKILLNNFVENRQKKEEIEKKINFCIVLNKRIFRDYNTAKNQKKLL